MNEIVFIFLNCDVCISLLLMISSVNLAISLYSCCKRAFTPMYCDLINYMSQIHISPLLQTN